MLTRRSPLAAPALVAAASTLPQLARAKAPLAGAPSAGVHRYKVGAYEITAIADGTIALGLELLPAAKTDADAVARLLEQAAVPRGGPIRNHVNTFVVNTGDRLVLVDTGTGPGGGFGPDLGRVPKNLAAAGIDPGAVDVVVITHLHPDHAGGLVLDGKAAFPNAELIVGEAEHRFWNDAGIMAQAPAEAKPFFASAQNATKPYAGRLRLAGPGEIAPGLSLVPAPGHTPGHSAVRVASGPEQLLIFADAVVMPAQQFERPDWSIAFDADQAQAAQTRRRILDEAATDRLLVAGSHLPFPAVGRVVRRGDAYGFVPQLWPTG
jgi:glyoxylase-like metal-dependent hydrolase (beta-lactamase superfamily II)